jgi:hypothetical protein
VPTRENLLRAMRWLVNGCDSGDSLVFHFSGHGVQKLDMNDDEVDGYNEALCPVDFEQSGKILDDEINEMIVRPLGRGVKLHAIVDTCHSGTILDLPYLCRLSRYTCPATNEDNHFVHSAAGDDADMVDLYAIEGRGTGNGRITTGLVGRGRSPTAAWPSPSAAAVTTRNPQTPAYASEIRTESSAPLVSVSVH